MAISVPNVVKITGSGVTSVTTSGVTTTTGSTFTVSSTADFGVTINTPTDSKSNTYGALGTSQVDDSNALRMSVFYKENGAGGAGHTATVTYSASTYPTAYFSEVAGAAVASYDSGSLAAATDNNGSPHDVTSGTFAQANNAVLSWCACDGGGTRAYSCSGFTVTQETDGSNYWTAATGYKLVTATTAQLASWVESSTRGLMKIVAFKEAAGGGSTYTPPSNVAQLFSQPQPASMAPMMRFASVAATALAVAAGGYVPTGANAALQAQLAYREPARLNAQPVVEMAPPAVAAVSPTPVVQVQQQPWPFATLETWRLQPEPAQLGGIAAIYLGAPRAQQLARADWPYTVTALPVLEPVAATMPVAGQIPFAVLPNIAQQAWGYAQLEAWRMAPEPATFGGITAVYAGPPPVRQIGQAPWPYASATAPATGPAATIPAASQIPAAATQPAWQSPWVHAAIETWRLQPEAATFAGITQIYLGPNAPVQPAAAQWPYAGALALQAGPAATIQVATQIPYSAAAVATSAPWPYLVALPRPAAGQWGIVQVYVGANAPPQVQQQAWPYAGAQLRAAAPIAQAAQVPYVVLPSVPPQPWPHALQQPRTASPILAAATVPPQQVFQGTAQSAWPYAAAGAQGAKVPAGQPAPVFFGASPIRQWATQSPWPYALTMPVQGGAALQTPTWWTTVEAWLVDARSPAWVVAERSAHAVVDARPADAKAQKR